MLPEHSNALSSANHTNGHNDHKITKSSKTNSNAIVSIDEDNDNSSSDSENNLNKEKKKKKRFTWISFQDNFSEAPHRRGRRLHGLQFPLHPLQLFGWIILIIFGISSFFVLIPSFAIELQEPLYGLLFGLYIVHIVSHLSALLLDPADRELRRLHRNDRIVPEFDRNRHTHVIENGRCHLCNIRTTSQRTKHCSVCNKCVGKFDHHCKWLNHCIGGRNYVAFLMCVVSAVIATLVILTASVAQIVLYHVNPQWLSFWYSKITKITSADVIFNVTLATDTYELNSNGTSSDNFGFNDTVINLGGDTITGLFNETLNDDKTVNNLTTIINDVVDTIITNGTEATNTITTATETISTQNSGIGLHDTIFLIFIGFLGVLAAITAGLLLHLCFFHIYISFLGLTTYEYIRNHRQNASNVPSTTPKDNLKTSSSDNDPSNRKCDIYFCSNLNNPNSFHVEKDGSRPTTLHCCENSREYHQTAMKTYYMCSMLKDHEPEPVESNDHYGLNHYYNEDADTDDNASNQSNSNEIHKSKTFHCCSQFARHSKLTGKTTTTTTTIPSAAQEIESTTTRSLLHFTEQCSFCTFRINAPSKSETVSLQDKRCLKTITKHHRWRRKWNCCANVPDSPDVPNDIIATISRNMQENANSVMNEQNNRNGTPSVANNNPTQIPAHFLKSNGVPRGIGKSPHRPRLIRPWPMMRFRHMLRAFGRSRRQRCRHGGDTPAKQNQIRPIATLNYDSGCSSPTNDEQIQQNNNIHSVETILPPTSVIRNDAYSVRELTMPTLPPPTRRKIPNPTDLDELVETLGFSHIPTQRLPSINSVYRRQRRKHFLRTRSPTLSPIHESGLSNPTSPQPCRHSVTSCSPKVVNKICGSTHSLSRNGSNGSLKNDSSVK